MFYGYFLKGTGSAIYARELVRALNAIGVDVVLFSQESSPEDLDFIEESYEIDLLSPSIKRKFSRRTDYDGKTVHYRPDLKGFLPVYVYDSYPGYRKVKTFSSMSEEEIEFYRSCLKQSVEMVLREHSVVPDGVLYHHLSPLPSMLFDVFKDYGIRQIAVYHGSDVNFALRKNKILENEFIKTVRMLDAIITLTVSGKNEVEKFIGKEAPVAIEVVAPGLDFSIFHPRKSREEAIEEFCRKFMSLVQDERKLKERKDLIEKIKKTDAADELSILFRQLERIEALKLTEPFACEILKTFSSKPWILFAGKYLWTKGAAALLFAMPYVWNRQEDAILLLVGFGSSRGILEKIRDYLGRGMLKEAAELTERHANADPGSAEQLILDVPVIFSEKLKDDGFLGRYRSLTDFGKFKTQVAFLGYLDHTRLAPVLSAADVFVAPSIFKESFGLVLIEAIACGTVPVASCHSGFRDTLQLFCRDMGLPPETLCVCLDGNFVENIANSIVALLERKVAGFPSEDQMQGWAYKNYSWDTAARKIASIFLS